MTKLKRGLIVSCQAGREEPLYKLGLMKYFAKCAVEGGAVGIRCVADDVKDIKAFVGDVPTIALVKRTYDGSSVYITPTRKEVDMILESGAECLAMDATLRTRPNGETLQELVRYVREKSPQTEIMADIATLEEAQNAEALGFDYIGCTLRGYTEQTRGILIPDFDFIKRFTATIKGSKVLVEGGIWETEQLKKISEFNPYAVVVGTAITRPKDITAHFNDALKLRA